MGIVSHKTPINLSTFTQNKTEVESVQLGKALSLIWTNVARANVEETVGICSRCPQEPTFKVCSRSGQ